ncbi:phosphodiester glycosidase family protein [Desulfoplanes sp.]
MALVILLSAPPIYAWETILPGIEEQTFALPPSIPEDGSVSFIRIDPEYFSFRLITQGTSHQKIATLKKWCEEKGLVLAINASMYREDRRQSTGYMKTRGLVNNGYINPRFGAFLVFDPKDPALPTIQIVDRALQDWRVLIRKYDTVVQNFRLVSAEQKNLWPENDKVHSIAAVGMDMDGKVLFMHCQTPISVHTFNEAILDLPVGLFNAMYVEGGPEAAMHLNLSGAQRSWMGQYQNPLIGTINQRLWPIPNVIGIVPDPLKAPPTTNNTGDPPCR